MAILSSPKMLRAMILIFLLSVGCTSATPGKGSLNEVGTSSASTNLAFTVRRVDTFQLLSDVEVRVFLDDCSVLVVGRTDAFGRIVVSKALLRDSKAIFFCKNLFFCGSFPERPSNLMNCDELNIYLAPFYT